jgi:hypothetical protein
MLAFFAKVTEAVLFDPIIPNMVHPPVRMSLLSLPAIWMPPPA